MGTLTLERLKKIKLDKNLVWGLITIAFIVFLLGATFSSTADNPSQFVSIVASGLYQGMLFFLVAAGLSIIFGLMDVLNFAQGSFFMVGAFVGFEVLSGLPAETGTDAVVASIYELTLAPVLAVLFEALLRGISGWRFPHLKKYFVAPLDLWGRIGLAGLLGVPLGILIGEVIATDFSTTSKFIRLIAAAFIAVLITFEDTRNFLFFVLRTIGDTLSVLFLRGVAMIFNRDLPAFYTRSVRPATPAEMPVPIVLPVVAAVFTALISLGLDEANLPLLRLGLAAIAAIFAGALVGMVMEVLFIRPTYVRPFYQIILTFGISLLILEFIKYRYGITPVQGGNLRPYMPSSITSTIGGDSIFRNVNRYWVFMIFTGLIMMVSVQWLLLKTRIGIIIRAGVQDSQMVEALGVNVRLIFTIVFALGTGIAAVGGVIAAGFLSVDSNLGGLFLLQAIAVVIVGGLGSYAGTAIASLLVGITQAVAEYFSTERYSTNSLGAVAVLTLLCVVLLIKPSGLFGKEH